MIYRAYWHKILKIANRLIVVIITGNSRFPAEPNPNASDVGNLSTDEMQFLDIVGSYVQRDCSDCKADAHVEQSNWNEVSAAIQYVQETYMCSTHKRQQKICHGNVGFKLMVV